MPQDMPPSEHEQEKIERLRRAMYSRDLSDKFGEHPRHALENEESQIGEDWQAQAPEAQSYTAATVTPQLVSVARQILKWLLIAAGGFCVIAVCFFAYYFLLGGSFSTSSDNIDIVVNGPPEVPSSSPVELQIAITNHNAAPLDLAELVITYPDGTRSTATGVTSDGCNSTDADPTTNIMRTQRICLGTIAPGATRPGTITPIFSGVSGAQATVKLELQYHLGGSNAIFTASKIYTFTFKTSSISLAVNGNAQTISGQPVQFTVGVTSNANIVQKDVLLHVTYPFGFTFTSASPAPDADGTWYLGDLAPGQTKNVQISGTMKGQSGDTRVFHINTGTRDSSASSTITNTLADQTYALKISGAFLGLSIQVNTGQDQSSPSAFSQSLSTTPYATPNSNVSVVIHYVNNLSSEIDNAVIVARLSGTQVDGTTVHSPDGIYRSSDGVVYWDSSTSQGKLARIAPGESGNLSFTFQAPAAAGQTNPHVDVSVNAAGKRTDESGVPQSMQAAAVQKIIIASDLQLNASGYYFANQLDKSGALGPMPPKAEQETKYEILFSLTNTTSDITNAKITAHLPPYVRWTDLYNTPQISANLANSTMTWNIGEIPPGTGVNGAAPLVGAFEIGFTPSASQIGQVPVLVDSIVLTGTDAATGEQITKTVSDITTNIVNDPDFTSSNATVVK